ncbi:MAG: hypothetical protein K6F44_02240 [Lachnospiraceae bacterium]|nr:hypothetical protein [Lachnospiraceae bacterium]
MTQKAKSSIFIVIISAVLLAIIGCSSGESREVEPAVVTPVVTVRSDPEPTLSPTPTPVVDMEEGSYDISEMPLFAIEGTDFVPLSFDVQQISSEREDGTPVIIQEDSAEADVESEEGEDSEGGEEPEEEKQDTAAEEGEDSGNVEVQKIYNTYKITLKRGLRFKDGSPVTADDVLFNIMAHASKDYKGDYALGMLDVPGMREFNTQVPTEEREKVDKIISAGGFDAEEEKYPEIEGIDPKDQDEVWGCYDEAGVLFAQDIIDYVNSNYALNAYVNAFMSGYLTYAKVEASENLKTAFAFIVWGYGRAKNPYNYRKNTLTTVSGKVYELNDEEIGAIELWEEIKEYYKGDLSEEGIDNDVAPGGKTIEELMAEAYFANQDYEVREIRGILSGVTRDERNVERECLYVTLSNEYDINDLNFFLTNPKDYENTGVLNDPEVIVEIEEDEEEGTEDSEGEASEEDGESSAENGGES